MSQLPKRGLGRGFESLLPADFDKSLLLTPEDRIIKLPLADLRANPFQPRKHFDEQSLAELAASIKRYGIVQPIVVSPVQDGTYALIAGERRWRAASIAGLQTVPAIVRSSEELEQLELALIENVQRVDLSPLEQAVSIERLHEQFSLSYLTIAERLGKANSTVNNIVRLLRLPEAARDALAAGTITEGHARAILALKNDPERQDYLLRTIISGGWNVRQAERFVTSVKAGTTDVNKTREHVSTVTPATQALTKKIGAAVNIRRTARGGKLEISFTSDAELDRLLHLFD